MMLSRLLVRISAIRSARARARSIPSRGESRRELGRRLLHFWVVWSALLFVHETGHAVVARMEGLTVTRITVGVGPVIWRSHPGDTRITLRLVPLAGMTVVDDPAPRESGGHAAKESAFTLAGGILATFAIVLVLAAGVAGVERMAGSRFTWGRFVIADAAVLTAFNLLPVPPLDGGRAVLAAIAAWRDAPLAGDALFWFHVGGLAAAALPMTLWMEWTRYIDRAALRWGAPRLPTTQRKSG